MKIEKLLLTFQNKETKPAWIPGDMIKFLTIDNISTSIQAVSKTDIDTVSVCERFLLVSRNKNRFTERLYQRLAEIHDITSITCSFVNDDGIRHENTVYMHWDITSKMLENPYQSVRISKSGTLYLAIAPVGTIEDFFELDKIDDPVWENSTYKNMSIGVAPQPVQN